jgi:hypothetical protein
MTMARYRKPSRKEIEMEAEEEYARHMAEAHESLKRG